MFTKEQIEKAKECKSVEELLSLLKGNDVELTEEEGKKLFAELNKRGELVNGELDNVAGSCGGDGPACPKCGSKNIDHVTEWCQDSRGNWYSRLLCEYVCYKCAHRWNLDENDY